MNLDVWTALPEKYRPHTFGGFQSKFGTNLNFGKCLVLVCLIAKHAGFAEDIGQIELILNALGFPRLLCGFRNPFYQCLSITEKLCARVSGLSLLGHPVSFLWAGC